MTLNENFQTFKKNSSNILQAFDKMAQYIFNNCYLEANGKKYDVTEIEFYYYQEKTHEDNYTYGKAKNDPNSPQLTSDQCYFHPSGFDLTFGSTTEYGGILVRGLRDENGQYISGPINCAKTISGNIRYSSKADNKCPILHCSKEEKSTPYTYYKNHIYKGPRIGLQAKNDFRWALYRYIVDFIPSHHFKEKEIVFAASAILAQREGKTLALSGYTNDTICRLKKNKPDLNFLENWKPPRI